jgi:hypothetical protein
MSGLLATLLLVQVPAVKSFQRTRSLLLPSNMPTSTSSRASLNSAAVQLGPVRPAFQQSVQSTPFIEQPLAGLVSVDDSRKRPRPTTMSP